MLNTEVCWKLDGKLLSSLSTFFILKAILFEKHIFISGVNNPSLELTTALILYKYIQISLSTVTNKIVA